MPKVEIKRNIKECNSFSLTFKGLTLGKVCALHNALQLHKDKSSVANDVYCLLHNAIYNSELQNILPVTRDFPLGLLP